MCFQKKCAPKTSPGAKKGEKKKNPWSDSDASDVDGDLSDVMDDMEVAPRERATGGRRAAANKAKFKFVSLSIKIFSFSLFISINYRMTLVIQTNLIPRKSFMTTLVSRKLSLKAAKCQMNLMMTHII